MQCLLSDLLLFVYYVLFIIRVNKLMCMTVIMKVHTMVRVFQDTVGEFSVYGNRRLPQQRSRHVHQCTVWKWHC